jgi:hypothetical protein
MSSAVQAHLNAQSASAINPDYYVDQNRGKQNLFEVDHVILNGSTLTLSRDLIHNRRLFATVTTSTTVRLPAPELCIGVEFEMILFTVASGTVSWTSTANASVAGSSAVNILGITVSIEPSAEIQTSGGTPKTSLAITSNSQCTILRFCSIGPYWFINGVSPAISVVFA